MSGLRGMYAADAELYDRIYSSLGYTEKAARLVELLTAEGVPHSARVLEAACGTGAYLAPLSSTYRMTGFDLSEAMLAISRRRNPRVAHFRADMTGFDVDDPFDAMLCLFSSIGYVHGEERLARTFAGFARALRPGGILVIEPWLSQADYRVGYTHMDTYQDEELKVARVSFSGIRGDRAVVDFQWAVARTGEGVDAFRERHELWFCSSDVMERCLASAGFAARFEPEGLIPGRGLWIGRRG